MIDRKQEQRIARGAGDTQVAVGASPRKRWLYVINEPPQGATRIISRARLFCAMFMMLASVAVYAQRQTDTVRVERITYTPHLVPYHCADCATTWNCEDMPPRGYEVRRVISCREIYNVPDGHKVVYIFQRQPDVPPTPWEVYLAGCPHRNAYWLLPPLVEVEEVDGQKIIVPDQRNE